jgi:hypothetical protein
MVSTLSFSERDLLHTVVGLARDEFRAEPDVLRRLLSRIERLPADRDVERALSVDVLGRPGGFLQLAGPAPSAIR